jgi:hypothetical protein
VPGDLTAVLTAVICAAFVTAAEPVQGLASLAIAGVLVGRIGLPPAVIAAGTVALAVWLIGFTNDLLTCRIDCGLPVRVRTCWRRTSRGYAGT